MSIIMHFRIHHFIFFNLSLYFYVRLILIRREIQFQTTPLLYVKNKEIIKKKKILKKFCCKIQKLKITTVFK